MRGLRRWRSTLTAGVCVEIRANGETFRATLLDRIEHGWLVQPEPAWRSKIEVADRQITRRINTSVERNLGPTVYYTERDAGGKFVGALHHRQVQALVACRAGLGRVRRRRHQSPWFCDYHLEPECDVYGIGTGTLRELQRWGYLKECNEEGSLELTGKGDRVLDEILELEGTHLPQLVTEAVPA